MSSFLGSITPDLVSSSSQISDISLSPDGSKVIYVVRPICKDDQNSTTQSSIWIAETDNTGSGRRFSLEGEQASSPSFHPDGHTIIYLSDNHQPGGPLQIHSLDLSGDFKPTLLWRGSSQPVTLFSISPSGEYVAFTSADESLWKKDTNVPEKLRIYSVATKQVTTIPGLNDSRHVNGFVWSPDSRELLFYTWPAKRPDYRESPMPGDQKSIDVYILDVKYSRSPRCVGNFNQTPGPWERQSFIWPTPTEVINISKYEPFYRSMDGMATQWHSLKCFDIPIRGGGEVDNPDSMIDLHFDGMVAVLVQRGMDATIEVWKGAKQIKTLVELKDAAISTANGSWHVRRLPNGKFSIAMIKSSGIDRQSEEIWITSRDANGGFVFNEALTAHNKKLEELDIMCTLLEWENNGIKLQGTVTYPSTFTPTSASLPTVLLIHSGPYSRITPDFKLDKFRLQLFLASHGYLVISPNYRGSSGRGSVFARVSGSQLITASWSDCDSMINHAVSLGLADPARLGLAGHSSGGYLAALGASITKAKYKACITWSGASDLVSLTGTSQTPEFQLSMSGLAPWLAEPEDLLQNVGGRLVHPSPVRNLEDLETPFLILHGEEDPQVPVSQAVVLWRGLKRLSRFPDRHVMVIYRREGHVFAEKGHLKDGLSRILDHLGKYLV